MSIAEPSDLLRTAGGIKFSEQGFKDTAAQLNSSLLVISVIAVLIPAGYSAAFSSTQGNEAEKAAILSMSRGISIILLLICTSVPHQFASSSRSLLFSLTDGAYLVFQLFTHQHLYAEGRTEESEAIGEGRLVYGLGDRRVMRPAKSVRKPRALEEDLDDEEEEEEIPTLSLWAALILLTIVTVRCASSLKLTPSRSLNRNAADPALLCRSSSPSPPSSSSRPSTVSPTLTPKSRSSGLDLSFFPSSETLPR